MRLAYCLSHPIQYKVPMLRLLSEQPGISLDVYFYTDLGLVEKPDAYHGHTAAWDLPLLDGYHNEILTNRWPFRRSLRLPVAPYLNPDLYTRLTRRKYDAVIIHSYFCPSDWLAFAAAHRAGARLLFYGDLYPRSSSGLARRLRNLPAGWMLAGCHAYLAIGSAARDVYVHEYRLPASKIFMAPYAVDNDFFIQANDRLRPQRAEIRRRLKLDPEIPVVLCVAGMVPKKRQQDLIAALSRVKSDFQLVLIGHGPLQEKIAAAAEQLPGTLLPGFVNQSALPDWYAAADIFVLPSLWEEFGLVVNEAMCASLPVIVTDTTGAARDLVVSGENGYTFPPGDVARLAELLETLLAQPQLRAAFGRASRHRIETWSHRQTVDGILQAAACS